MLLYSLCQTRKSLSSLILNPMLFVPAQVKELFFLEKDMKFGFTTTVIKTTIVKAILDILIKLLKELLTAQNNLKIIWLVHINLKSKK